MIEKQSCLQLNYLIFMKIILLLAWSVLCYGTDNNRYVSLISDNDIYAPKAQDRHYTNGLRLGFNVSNNKLLPKMPGFLVNSDLAVTYRNELAIGHNIYTPENYISNALQVNDRPFEGWLYSEYTTVANTRNNETAMGVNIGLVGPAALGKQIQTFNHSIINDPKPLGWNNQLKNEPALLLKYRRSLFSPTIELNTIRLGLIARLGLNLGNVFTDAGGGLVLRLGSYLPNQELPLRIHPGYSGNTTRISIRNNRFDWQLYAKIMAEAYCIIYSWMAIHSMTVIESKRKHLSGSHPPDWCCHLDILGIRYMSHLH